MSSNDQAAGPGPSGSDGPEAPDEPTATPLERLPEDDAGVTDAARDIADVGAVELITTVSVHLLSAAALRCGLAEEGEDLKDLDEARTIINALAGLVTAAAPDLGDTHARVLRDGLRSVQLAFREASVVPDRPGDGPGEKYTGAVT
ncbi:DUF1844 domain-containing protein [Demequina sp. SYSU T00192]|uniref:DUF1844 domain-containing protein n=1 Tax=Demequina litoralis TaxID=3051660 RepID=A0ABT8GAP1_9MICO|nr:DUF1844 domain-containing protein [Demequina sp. SYSU T00192]MDN4476218.1 DUF1844 domain-containing protein [Demequina sp. SYSU T00192]